MDETTSPYPNMASIASDDTTTSTPALIPLGTYNIVVGTIVLLIFILGAIGIPCGILTIRVYVRLGFAENIHISYTALAIADLGVCIVVVWLAILQVPAFSDYVKEQLGAETPDLVLICLGGLQRAFNSCSALMTAFISLERCLCVLFPQKVKVMMTHRRIIKIISAFFLVSTLAMLLHFGIYFEEWHSASYKNATINISEILYKFGPINILAFSITVVCTVGAYITVAVCTTLLIIKLKQSFKWRLRNSNFTPQAGGKNVISRREGRITKTVIIIAIIFIVCTLPITANMIAYASFRQFTVFGSLRQIFVITSGANFALNALNSSINIFVYLYMSSKFREQLKSMMPCKASNKSP